MSAAVSGRSKLIRQSWSDNSVAKANRARQAAAVAENRRTAWLAIAAAVRASRNGPPCVYGITISSQGKNGSSLPITGLKPDNPPGGGGHHEGQQHDDGAGRRLTAPERRAMRLAIQVRITASHPSTTKTQTAIPIRQLPVVALSTC